MKRVVVIGAGAGGLAAAMQLAASGYAVTVVERAGAVGGKLRELNVGGAAIDAGPTVLTMPWVFERLFQSTGRTLADHVRLKPAEILARHFWSAAERLDLFADPLQSEAAIGAFAGAREARGFRGFCREAGAIHRILKETFLSAQKPNLPELMWRVGLLNIGDQLAMNPYENMWGAIRRHFRDPRLAQLFARYATYGGSSPFKAPATLLLIAHVEQEGVWLVEGGMYRLAEAMAAAAAQDGATIRLNAPCAEIIVRRGRAAGVRLESGEQIEADAVLLNADSASLRQGLLGGEVRGALPAHEGRGSLSALVWTFTARAPAAPFVRHTVAFAPTPYRDEFRAIGEGRLPAEPTVYVCAQDRDAKDPPAWAGAAPTGPERFLVIVNAPPHDPARPLTLQEIDACERTMFARLKACGLSPDQITASRLTTPAEFAALFPATSGALYGRPMHGWTAAFQRPGSRSRLPGLYLAGGSVHPGAGLPMASLSGMLAAQRVSADLASTRPSGLRGTAGGTSTPKARTGASA